MLTVTAPAEPLLLSRKRILASRVLFSARETHGMKSPTPFNDATEVSPVATYSYQTSQHGPNFSDGIMCWASTLEIEDHITRIAMAAELIFIDTLERGAEPKPRVETQIDAIFVDIKPCGDGRQLLSILPNIEDIVTIAP